MPEKYVRKACDGCRKMPTCEASGTPLALVRHGSCKTLQGLLLLVILVAVQCSLQTNHTGPWQRSLLAGNDGSQVHFTENVSKI